VARYRARLSGPLLDRIDLRVALEAVGEADLDAHRAALANGAAQANATTDAMRLRKARACQLARQGRLNADLAGPDIECRARLTREASTILAQARDKLGLSLRGTHRTQRVARTLADLDGAEQVGVPHVAEAIQLRRALPGD
jgi:magnesium chelatase family protein